MEDEPADAKEDAPPQQQQQAEEEEDQLYLISTQAPPQRLRDGLARDVLASKVGTKNEAIAAYCKQLWAAECRRLPPAILECLTQRLTLCAAFATPAAGNRLDPD